MAAGTGINEISHLAKILARANAIPGHNGHNDHNMG